MLKALCKQFVARAEALGLKGKKRDGALMEFMCGSYAALQAAGHAEAEHVGTVIAMIFSVRGFSECQKIASEP